MESSQEEVVYGSDAAETTNEESTGNQDVMSEKVGTLAQDIYAEFQRLMGLHGQDVVKNLMPLVVNVLESLDLSSIENQEHQVELELVKEDNEQLATQYEREKCLRKASEQKLLEVEYTSEEDRNELLSKVESLASIVRMLEMKAKSSADHAARLEEKETEMKKEYAKLHDRYTELFKTHFDYVEKTKILFGASQNQKQATTPVEAASRLAAVTADIRSPEELQTGWKLEQFSPDKDLSMSEALSPTSNSTVVEPMVDNTKVRRPNTLYQECKFTENEERVKDEDAYDVGAGGMVDPAEFASSVSDNLFGMGKEVENIILENIELLATKNALNIVKDDLIARVDLLTSEKEIVESQLHQSELQREAGREKIEMLEAEIKKLKDNMEQLQSEREQQDNAIPLAHRKRFTRFEMARVIMEKNQYKDRLLELQEAVRWSETLRATKLTESSFDKPGAGGGGIFKFPNFSNLFASDKNKVPSTSSSGVAGGIQNEKEPQTKASLHNIQLRDGISERKAKERRDQLKKVKAHVAKDDIGRVQAYGWSLPTANGQNSLQSVPVPVFCRPLDQSDPNPQLKVWCASGVHLPPYSSTREINDPTAEMAMSSLVWICSNVQNRFSQVSVIDANNPAEVLDTFKIGSSLILCIQSVPGTKNDDFVSDDAYLAACIRALNPSETSSGIVTKAEPGLNAVSEMLPEELKPEDEQAEGSADVSADATENVETPESQDTDASEKMSTQLPTMWLGAQNGQVFVHSSKADWSSCIMKVRLSDSVVAIAHHRGRVFCSLANGRMAVFHRDPQTKEFCGNKYREIVISPSPDSHSIRCVAVVLEEFIWCGYRNCMAVINAETLEVQTKFSVHPRKESQVRQMATAGEGVWITIRTDSTFRLYHAKTHQHLQDVDIEPLISRMIGTGKLGFSFVRITCIGITCNRLWIGTGNGVILSLPLFCTGRNAALGSSPQATVQAKKSKEADDGVAVNETTDLPLSPVVEQPLPAPQTPLPVPGSCVRIDDQNIPYCNLSQAQLSFHGHKDSVRFIIGVPGTGGMISTTSPVAQTEGGTTPPARCMFVLSGGEGYVDLRIGDEASASETTHMTDKSDLSHLIRRLSRSQLETMGRDTVIDLYFESDEYIRHMESSVSHSISNEERQKLKQQITDLTQRENLLVLKMTLKEQQVRELQCEADTLRKRVIPQNSTRLRANLMDPTVDLLFKKMKKELDQTNKKLKETQEELSAWKFTPESNAGKRLMAQCRQLYQENEELGKRVASGKVAKLEGDLALYRSFAQEMKQNQKEQDELLLELDEEVEGMQSTIYLLEQQLSEAKELIKNLNEGTDPAIASKGGDVQPSTEQSFPSASSVAHSVTNGIELHEQRESQSREQGPDSPKKAKIVSERHSSNESDTAQNTTHTEQQAAIRCDENQPEDRDESQMSEVPEPPVFEDKDSVVLSES
ncbi:JNK-interacting protein 3 [Galendromus occidentalis]|uniref:JNK-interacting protein 3 n=1 Tax=Galendromus occidentalis TaxID=34638 RepID=A0AAJ7SK18_9ACAR|nr:JNK-interacting protein 3 [Galendromus occidentalis]